MSRRLRRGAAAALTYLHLPAAAALAAAPAAAQVAPVDRAITRVDLPTGRSFPIETTTPITRVSVANADVADVVVIGPREVVVNGKAAGETDVILWGADVPRRHFRVLVHSPSDRQQIVLAVKFAEVRRDFLLALNSSGVYRDQHTRVGTGLFKSDNPINRQTGAVSIPAESRFLTILSDLGTDKLLAFLESEEQRGLARTLAEPNLMAANKEDATFLAGGELPIPVAQSAQAGGVPTVTITYREFGIRLFFNAEIVSDSLIKLKVRPEVSSLDFANAVVISGFRVPALRTRRVESTLDVRRDQSLVISGLFDDERQRARTGVPILSDIPILGALFSSTTWQRNESELVVIVTPVVVDPLHPRARDVLQFQPDTTLPARGALEKRLAPEQRAAPPGPPRD